MDGSASSWHAELGAFIAGRWAFSLRSILVVWCACIACAVALYYAANQTPPIFDPAFHFLDGVRLIRDPLSSRLVETNTFYPWLVQAVSAPIDLVDNNRYSITAAVVEIFFFLLTVVATYLMARRLFDDMTGVIAAVFLSLYPLVFGASLTLMLDLALASAVVLTCYFALRSRYFENRRDTLLLGLVVGLGTFTKFPFPFFVLLPLLSLALRASVRGVLDHRAGLNVWPRIRNFLDGSIIAIACAVPWYIPRLSFLTGDFLRAQRGASLSRPHPTPLSLDWFLYYPAGLWQMTSLAFAAAFVILGAVFAVEGRVGRLELGLWLVGGYITLTVFGLKELRFAIPVLPAVAIVTAAGARCMAMRLRRVTFALVGALVIFGVFQLYAAIVGVSWLPRGQPVSEFVVGHGSRPTLLSQDWGYVPRIHRRAWDPVRFIAHASAAPGVERRFTVNIIAAGRIGRAVLRYAIERQELLGPPPRPLFSEAPAAADFPADVLVAQVPAGRTPASTHALRDFLQAHDLTAHYREFYRERGFYPVAGSDFILYRRVS